MLSCSSTVLDVLGLARFDFDIFAKDMLLQERECDFDDRLVLATFLCHVHFFFLRLTRNAVTTIAAVASTMTETISRTAGARAITCKGPVGLVVMGNVATVAVVGFSFR